MLLSGMPISQNLDFFGWFFFFQFFSHFFCFPFSLPFYSLYLQPFIPFLSTGKILASILQKTVNGTLINWVTWPILPPVLHPKLTRFFWYSSTRLWSIFKMDTCMDGSVLAVLAANQNNLVSSENDNITSGSMSPDSNVGKKYDF